MTTDAATQKVTVFALSDHGVLVFDHPFAGTQFPAGTVEPNEHPADAAVRELAEETGLIVDAAQWIGATYSRREDGVLYAVRDLHADDGARVPAGYRVESNGPGTFLRRVMDYTCDPPVERERHAGACDTADLTPWVLRNHFIVRVDARPAWSWTGDDNHVWQCRFTPLSGLQPFGEQGGWLGFLQDHLRL